MVGAGPSGQLMQIVGKETNNQKGPKETATQFGSGVKMGEIGRGSRSVQTFNIGWMDGWGDRRAWSFALGNR